MEITMTMTMIIKIRIIDDDDVMILTKPMISRYTASDYQGGTLVEGIAQSAKECQVVIVIIIIKLTSPSHPFLLLYNNFTSIL